MSRRDQITMTRAEVETFLAEQRTLTCASFGTRGWPHLAPLWYVVRDGELWAWTFAKSQKARNLARDARATVQVEAGTEYAELRGVTLECEVVLHHDHVVVTDLGLEILARYGGDGVEGMRDFVAGQAAKRVGLQFVEQQRATWDHRKLGGGY